MDDDRVFVVFVVAIVAPIMRTRKHQGITLEIALVHDEVFLMQQPTVFVQSKVREHGRFQDAIRNGRRGGIVNQTLAVQPIQRDLILDFVREV